MAGAPKPRPMTADEARKADASFAAYLAGIADLGGFTSNVSRLAGYEDMARALTEAQQAEPDAADVGSMVNPLGILGPIYDFGAGAVETGKDYLFGDGAETGPPKVVTEEEFFSTRRKPRGTLQEAITTAEEKARNSPAYQGLVGQKLKDRRGSEYVPKDALKRAETLLKDARTSAEASWRADQTEMRIEEQRLKADFEAYKGDIDRQLQAYWGRSFADRNPGISKMLALGGPLAAALVTRGAAKWVGKKGSNALDDLARARGKGGSLEAEAEALKRAKYWDKHGGKAVLATGAGAATLPFDFQAYADLVDWKGLPEVYQDTSGNWQPVAAQKRADDKFSDPWGYIQHNAPLALISGAMGAATGAHFGRQGSRPDELHTAANPPTADDLKEMADRRIAAIDEAARIKAAEQAAKAPPRRPPAGEGTGPTPIDPILGDPPQGGPQSPSNGRAPPGPRSTDGFPGNAGRGQSPQGSAPVYSPYRLGPRAEAQRVWNETLDRVPLQARQEYTPDGVSLIDDIEAGVASKNYPPVNPDALRSRLGGSVDQFNTIRASGGDPFSPAARASMTGGKEKLALALMTGGGAAGGLLDGSADSLSPAQIAFLLEQLQQDGRLPGLFSDY